MVEPAATQWLQRNTIIFFLVVVSGSQEFGWVVLTQGLPCGGFEMVDGWTIQSPAPHLFSSLSGPSCVLHLPGLAWKSSQWGCLLRG